jgi:hypothetical protein
VKRGPKLSGGAMRLNKSRGGAPKGERADRKARAASADAAIGWMRLSALRFPLRFGCFGS